jgi:hypothetical protein
MRRGLMRWDESELPEQSLGQRLSRLQSAMERERLDAFLIYTNLVRPSAASWLTAFTPYWIESLLLVAKDGAPILATALSKRVADWIRSTSRLGEIINTPKPGTAIGTRLTAAGAKRIGVLELDALPGGLYDDLMAAAPAAELIDASGLFSVCRRSIDPVERSLIDRADAIATAALAQVDPPKATDAGELAGVVEKSARLDAAEEAYIAVAPDLDADRRFIRAPRSMPLGARFVVRASIAYKGHWVRRTRTFARDEAGSRAIARADAWFAQLVEHLDGGQPLASRLQADIASLPGAALQNWTAESSIGSYPLEVIASSAVSSNDALPRGSFAVLSIELKIDGVAWLGAAPAFVS